MDSIRHVSTRTVAGWAAAALSAFPSLVIAANFVQRDHYSAAREAVSNLALGQAGWMMTLAFLSLSTGTLLLAVVVRRLASRAIVGPVFLTLGACTTLLSAVFQTDAEGAGPTLHGTIHIAVGIGSFILVIGAMIACAITLLRTGSHRRTGIASVAWAVSAIGSVVTTFVLPDSLFGIGQRLFFAVAISWMLTMCVVAFRGAGTGARDRRPAAVAATLRG